MNVAYYSKGRGVIASFITVPPTSHLSWCLAGTVRKPGFHSFLRKAKSNVHNLKGFWVRCSSGADCLAALFVVYLFPPFSSWNSPVRLGWTASKTSLYLPGTGITSHTIMPQGFFGGGCCSGDWTQVIIFTKWTVWLNALPASLICICVYTYLIICN